MSGLDTWNMIKTRVPDLLKLDGIVGDGRLISDSRAELFTEEPRVNVSFEMPNNESQFKKALRKAVLELKEKHSGALIAGGL